MRMLLAVDGSEQSHEAARALEHLPSLEYLIVLHVMDVPWPAYPTMMPEVTRELYAMAEQAMREDGECLLNRVISILPQTSTTVSRRLEIGSPAETIVATAEKEAVDMIVMGARGLGPVKEVMFGSVSHRVVTHAPCSTLVVTAPMRSLRTVLLTVEGQEDADAAMRFLGTKPLKNLAEISVLTVLPTAKPFLTERVADDERIKEMALKCAWRFVEDVASRLSTYQYCATPTATTGRPVEEIIRHASEIEADLIVMGSKSRSGVSRFLLGSVSHAILHRAAKPVLIYR